MAGTRHGFAREPPGSCRAAAQVVMRCCYHRTADKRRSEYSDSAHSGCRNSPPADSRLPHLAFAWFQPRWGHVRRMHRSSVRQPESHQRGSAASSAAGSRSAAGTRRGVRCCYAPRRSAASRRCELSPTMPHVRSPTGLPATELPAGCPPSSGLHATVQAWLLPHQPCPLQSGQR